MVYSAFNCHVMRDISRQYFILSKRFCYKRFI